MRWGRRVRHTRRSSRLGPSGWRAAEASRWRKIARDLGVSSESLRLWVKQARIDDGEREGLATAEREELRRLRRENLVLRQEREVLKKAAAFFARESETR